MGVDRSEVRAFYDAEASAGSRRRLRGVRLDLLGRFVELLSSESRRSVIDFGAGPGLDLAQFATAGIDALGVDLAHGNCVRAAADGLVVFQASVDAVPVRPGSFSAGWSMSTLMHLDNDVALTAARQIVGAVEPGGPVRIGLWGLDVPELVVDVDDAGNRRPFHLRSVDGNMAILARAGSVVSSEIAHRDDAGWEYQVFLVRNAG